METNIKNLDEISELIKKRESFKFKIKVIAGSKTDKIEFQDEIIKVKIKEKPIEGRANKAIIEYLAKNFKIAKSNIEITSGLTSSIKIILISF